MSIENDVQARLDELDALAESEFQHHIEKDKRAAVSLDLQIETLAGQIERTDVDIERAYDAIRGQMVAIKKWVYLNDSRKQFLTLLEMFRDELENGKDVTDEHTFDPHVENFIEQTLKGEK